MTIGVQQFPDGGYGWVIVLASSISNLITLSLIQCFGLVLKDIFAELDLSATQSALIITLNGCFGMLIGPIIGVFQKIFGCRKTAVLGAVLLTMGVILTSLTATFGAILATYGLLGGLGLQACDSTHRLAINLYFKKKRSMVTGFIMTIAGFGPILIPQLLRYLLKAYTTKEVTLIYGGICAHSLIAGVLLQPVEWHIKQKGTKEETVAMKTEKEEKIKEPVWSSIARIFDLDLLKDPIFDNILMGLALATFAEMNFTLLIPFILRDFNLNTDQTAIFLSTLGVADMISRFVSPYIGNYFTKPPRLMFAYSLVILTLIKFTIIIFKNYYVLLVIAFALGMAKGIRKVYMWLVIPDYVPLEKLPSAAGMDLLARGVCILTGGAILGVLRDATGSYTICVIVMNCVMILVIILWAAEALILKLKTKKLPNKDILL